MKNTNTKQYLAYHKAKRKFFDLDEVELRDKDVEIYEFTDENFRLVTD